MTDYISEFYNFISDLGYSVKGEITETGGKWRSIALEGDKGAKKSGAYRFQVDGYGAVGQFKCWREGIAYTYSSKHKKEWTKEEKAAFKAQRQKEQREAEEKEAKKIKRLSIRLKKYIAGIPDAPADHPYLKRKKIKPHGVKYRAKTKEIILPVYTNGAITSLQKINEKGGKFFLRGGAVSGGYYPLAAASDNKDILCIAEGFATAASIREATGFPVFCAFNAGNLKHVAEVAAKKYPDSHFIITADNDQFTQINGKPYNTGREKATEAAFKIGAQVVWPEFEDLSSKPTDFNDLHCLKGLDAVKNKIQTALDTRQELSSEADSGAGANYPQYATPAPIGSEQDGEEHWTNQIAEKKRNDGSVVKGAPEPFSLKNVILYLTHHPKYKKRIAYDEFKQTEIVIGSFDWDQHNAPLPRKVTNYDITMIRMTMEDYGLKVTKDNALAAIEAAALNNKINPLKTYIESQKWDGEPRLDTWITDYVAAPDQPKDLVNRFGACFMMAIVKRILKPGTPFHHMLVIEGGQGATKSSLFRELATFDKSELGTFFNDTISFDDITKDDTTIKLQGNIIVEFQELSGLNKKDREKVKQWITQDTDQVQKKYQNVITFYPRQFVLAGTTNENAYLTDPTGNRRFWPVGARKMIDLDGIAKVKEQLWAEAYHRVISGEIHYIPYEDPLYQEMQNQQASRYDGDPWENLIESYVENRAHVIVDEVLGECLNIPKERWDKNARWRISNTLRSLSFENKVKRINGKNQRIWENPKYAEQEIPFD